MSSAGWPDWSTPEPEPVEDRRQSGGPVLFGLGPVGIAGIVALVLILFGVGAVIIPPMFASGSTDTLPPAVGAASNDAQSAGPEATTAAPEESPSATETTTAAPAPSVSTNARFQAKVVDLVNRERARARQRCAEVRADAKLQAAAGAHSADMATRNFFSHTGADGSSPFDRMRAAGYPQGMSENIAKGQSTPEQVMKAWMDSSGHRANILDCNAKALGVGLAYRGRTPYWTQNFGRA